jgi:hypothetical protein
MSIQLQGQTRFMPLPDLLQWLEHTLKSGVLTIKENGPDQSFYFEDGAIIFVSSIKPGQRFGEFLAQTGHIDEQTVNSSLLESRKFGICFTQYLMDEQMVPKETLTLTLIRLAEVIVQEVIANPKCTFLFTAPLPKLIADGPIRIASGHLILDSLRKKDEQIWKK